jgi:hypothetical protein
MGAPVGKGMSFDNKGSSKSKSQVTGYAIIEAKDADQVKAIVANHPHLMMPKASIEVLEIMPMMM